VNWFPFDMDAWNRRTKEFGHTHRGIYVTLLAWYYGTGGPLPLSWERLYRIGEAQTAPEREALHEILAACFECSEDGWRNVRADEELAHFHASRDPEVTLSRDMSVTGVTRHASRGVTPSRIRSDAARQRRYRDMKSAVAERLNMLGATCSRHQPFSELQEIATRLGVVIDASFLGSDKTAFVTRDVTIDTRNHSNSSALLSSGGAREQGKPEGGEEAEIAQKSGNSEPFTLVDSPVAELCRRVKQQGVFGLYPSHPRLAELLALGVQAEAMVAIAAETVARGKGLAWMLATAKGRHMDQTQRTNPAQQGPKSGRGDIKTDRLRAWVPELVQAPQTPDFASFDDRMPHAPAE